MFSVSLTTQRLLIRDHKPEDLNSHHALMSDKKVMYYLQDIMSHSPEDSLRNLNVAMSFFGDPLREFYFFRIETKSETKSETKPETKSESENQPEYVGQIGYTVKTFAPQGKSVEVGYFLREKFWGQGLATEALTEVIRHAFEENGVFRITCGCAKENIGSERVMIKCGLIKEAEFKAYQLLNGEMIDRVVYRLLKSEWNHSS